MNILLCIDHYYYKYSFACIRSLISHHDFLNLNIFYMNLSKSELQSYESFVSSNVCLNLIRVDDADIHMFPTPSHFSAGIYLRMFAGKYLEFDKVLYVDCDTVCTRNLSSLYNLELDGYHLAAVRDFDLAPQVNSGVLLMNLARWRSDFMLLRLKKYIVENSENLIYPDQDAINNIGCEILTVNDGYNYQLGSTSEVFVERPSIVHFTGSTKPWHLAYNGEYSDLFWKYFNRNRLFNSKVRGFRDLLSFCKRMLKCL